MRSQWKVKNFLYNSMKMLKGSLYLFKRRGFLNPLLIGRRVNVYIGGKFRNYKVRPEMVMQPLNSFVITRPPFSSIRKKFLSLRKRR